MIKPAFLLFLLTFCSCASFKKRSIFELAEQTKHSVIKKDPASSAEVANKILQTRYNYLKLMFEQSRDPYYGHPKWTENCLEQNKIGSVTNTGHEIRSISELYVDYQGEPGFCPENPFALKAYEIGFFCEKEHLVYRITLPGNADFDLKKVRLCQ